MVETYNPQERTFIKKPEQRICITCGQPLPIDIKPLTNHMNRYINPISGNVVTMNSKEDTMVVQGVTLYRVTGTDSKGKFISSLIPAKSAAPATPPSANPPSKA